MKSSFEKNFKNMNEKVFFRMNNNYLEWNCIIWNEIEVFTIQINKKEFSRSVPIRNVPLHREEGYMATRNVPKLPEIGLSQNSEHNFI